MPRLVNNEIKITFPFQQRRKTETWIVGHKTSTNLITDIETEPFNY